MSKALIEKYYSEVEKLIRYGGITNETAIRNAFYNLLTDYCGQKNFILVAECPYITFDGKSVTPDGTVKDALRLDWGYWESKDTDDDFEVEIEKKFRKGYPKNNILFENSEKAILYQGGSRAYECFLKDAESLNRILNAFVSYERVEIRHFRQAIDQFKNDLPNILEALRELIEKQFKTNKIFKQKMNKFLELCKDSINPHITPEDIREMIIQHILTEEIFLSVFNESQFHRENNIAKELQELVDIFFTRQVRADMLGSVENYYLMIKESASGISDHHEKQKFLKELYQNFYKAYNVKAADRLGVIYTPNEIVRFMVDGAEYLVEKHFGKVLSDKNVEILDPFTGTGTFITELIDHFPISKLEYKYKNELHCNEVAILPYYVGNLNIEYTYKQKMGRYEEFKNICFVDTIDNLGFTFKGILEFEGFSAENLVRIKNQNDKKISVVISNPPYNANQLNENENNKNREYPLIDDRIKKTYIAQSKAQKTKLYDMYARSLRWASDRLCENGVIAFVSNNSFINSKTYDGFRKCVAEEFNEIWIIDLKGNARTSGERRRQEGGNVFSNEIRVGVSIYFLVRKEKTKGCKIYYNSIHDYAKADEKKEYLVANTLTKFIDEGKFEKIIPDKKNNWINIADNDFDELLTLADKKTKLTKDRHLERALFKMYSLGVVTARDEWVYSEDRKDIEHKVNYLINTYNNDLKKFYRVKDKTNLKDVVDYSIKWTRAVKNDLLKGKKYQFNKDLIIDSIYRPFVKKKLYFSKELNEMQYQLPKVFSGNNVAIAFSGEGSSKPFHMLVQNQVFNHDTLEKTQCLPLYRYDKTGNKIENITDWGLKQFTEHYKDKKIKKEDIFYYVYGVLHNTTYRKKYELNLKREFPRVPYYDDFWKWREWGKKLMEIHLNYETVKPYKFERVEINLKTPYKDRKIKTKLKADKVNGIIEIDELTTLKGIPNEAWEYKLGNRCALEWILDQYKEKKPKDPTIRAKFNIYKFADYKEQVIDLLKRVCSVSVETMKILREMEEEK